jgi:signal transduction histidine kinase
LASDQPVLGGSLADDPELARYTSLRRCSSALAAPLRAASEIYGTVLLASSRSDAYRAEHIKLLKAVASQASVALTNAHLFQDLCREKEQMLSVEQRARTKLAHDLHDGPTQAISAIAMRLNYARLLLVRDPSKVRDEMFSLENLARRTTKDIRTLLFTLRPLVLETQGLEAALEQLAANVTETSDLDINLEIEDIEGQLDASTQTVAWFITEECLANVQKHASAKSVRIRMGLHNGFFVAEIEDDGCGFSVEDVMEGYDQRASYGLLGMQERAALVHGRTTIESMPGTGTRITLTVPLSQEVD